MTRSAGIHHITGIAGSPRRHVEFYTRVLGLRMVKRTVNFDNPGTWHLYYGNETGAPGTTLTFFIWDNLPAGRPGVGQAVETAFAIPAASIGYWMSRLVEEGVPDDPPAKRFRDPLVGRREPHGPRLVPGGPGAAPGGAAGRGGGGGGEGGGGRGLGAEGAEGRPGPRAPRAARVGGKARRDGAGAAAAGVNASLVVPGACASPRPRDP